MNPAQIRLRSWYETIFLRTYHSDASPRTVAAYLSTVVLWELMTNDPVLSEVTNLTMSEFRAAVLALPRARATVNKHCRHLNHLLTKAGPPGPRNRDALGIIGGSPWAKPLKEFHRTPSVPTVESIERVYSVATEWQKALVVTLLHSGSRLSAVRALTPSRLDWAKREATMVAETDKRHTERTKPLSRCVLRHLVRLRGCSVSTPFLAYAKSESQFRRDWQQLLTRARLTGDQRFTPHGLKRLCGSLLAELGASQWAVRHQMDHAQRDVTGRHYLSVMKELGKYVELLPVLDGERALRRDEQMTITWTEWA